VVNYSVVDYSDRSAGSLNLKIESRNEITIVGECQYERVHEFVNIATSFYIHLYSPHSGSSKQT